MFVYRGSRKHRGVDIECRDGSKVYAPLDLTITRQSTPYGYGTNSAINDGIAFTAEGLSGFNTFTQIGKNNNEKQNFL